MRVKLSNLYPLFRNMKIVSFLLPFIFLLASVYALLSVPPYIANTQNRVFDQYNRWLPRQPLNDAVVFVDIDEASLQKFGQFPWQEGVRLCKNAEIENLAIIHHAPKLIDAMLDARADKASKLFKNAFVASDFLKIHLNPS